MSDLSSDAVATTDHPTMSAPQLTADFLMGTCQAGYHAQMILAGAFFALFVSYLLSGELRAHNRLARAAMWASVTLNVVYTAVVFYEGYDAAVSQNRSYIYLANGNTTWNVISLLNGLIAALSESYLAMRAGALIPSRKVRYAFWVWIGCLVALVLAGSAITTADGYFYLFGATDQTLPLPYNTAAAIWLYASALADLSISAACGYALKTRIAGFNETTDSLLRRLIFIAVRTASYTTILSIAAAVLLSIYNDNDLLGYVSIALWLPMPALYGLSLFTFSASSRRAIDARLGPSMEQPNALAGGIHVRRSVHAVDSKGIPLERLSFSRERFRSGALLSTAPLQISVQQQSVIEYDDLDLEAGEGGASPSEKAKGESELSGRQSTWTGEQSWK